MLRDRFFSPAFPSGVSMLSERRCFGTPFVTITSASVSITLVEYHVRSDWIIRHSRVCSSIRFNSRTVLPSYVFPLSRVKHQRRNCYRRILIPASKPDVHLSLCIRFSRNTDVCRSSHPTSAFHAQHGEKELLDIAFAP